MIRISIINYTLLLIAPIGLAFADKESYADNESAVISNAIAVDYFKNDAEELANEEDIKVMRDSYISPYNYIQNPISQDLGLSSKRSESGAALDFGFSVNGGANQPLAGQNKAFNTNMFQIWAQSDRWSGFALGGGGTALVSFNQIGQPNTFGTTSVFSLNQAYIDYQYSNRVQVTAGNIIINTPWVNSNDNSPGSVYSFGNNTYQGVMTNILASDGLLLQGFYAWQYWLYPNNWFTHQTLYNVSGSPFNNLSGTNGVAGVGVKWNPVKEYTGQLWAYNFADYAKMAYFDNTYHVPMTSAFSFDFSGQGFMQSSSGQSIISNVTFPGQSTTAGEISSNGVGAKIALNIGNNTSSISYNNVFGGDKSFLNGGMVTPYTYGLETDPLYTTPALNSIAELGSGSAYTIRNSTLFMENALKFSLSFSQFFVNQVYLNQPNLVTEYDGTLLYQVPKTNFNIWMRLVYQDKGPVQYGGEMWQPRVNLNWYF